MHIRVPSLGHLGRATLMLVSGKQGGGAISRVAVTRNVVDTTVLLVKPLVIGDAGLCESWVFTPLEVTDTGPGF